MRFKEKTNQRKIFHVFDFFVFFKFILWVFSKFIIYKLEGIEWNEKVRSLTISLAGDSFLVGFSIFQIYKRVNEMKTDDDLLRKKERKKERKEGTITAQTSHVLYGSLFICIDFSWFFCLLSCLPCNAYRFETGGFILNLEFQLNGCDFDAGLYRIYHCFVLLQAGNNDNVDAI